MPRYVALEWDTRQARLAVGRTRGRELVIEHLVEVDAPPDASGPGAVQAWGEKIGAALSARGVSRAEALAAIGRANIELRRLSLPPAPPDELPDLVRFQALREFAAVGDNWPIDFTHVPTTEGQSAVLAAAIAPEMVEQARRVCQLAGASLGQLALRPFAAGSLLAQRRPEPGVCRIFVDVLAEEADLTVLLGNDVAFVRTIRLPDATDEAYLAGALTGELRRTMAAAQNQLGGRRVEQVIVGGGAEEHAELRRRCGEALNLPVEPFDPLEGLTLSAELSAAAPTRRGRFAPLIGLLVDAADERRPAIDFLSPRRRPQAPSNRRVQLLAAGAAAALVVAIVGGVWFELGRLDRRYDELTRQSKSLDANVKAAQAKEAELAELEAYLAADVVWLDELARVSEKLPPGEQAIVEQWRASPRPAGGGQLVLDGRLAKAELLQPLEQSLRDARRQVAGKGTTTDDKSPAYPWVFSQTVVVAPGDDDDEPAAASAPAAHQTAGGAAR